MVDRIFSHTFSDFQKLFLSILCEVDDIQVPLLEEMLNLFVNYARNMEMINYDEDRDPLRMKYMFDVSAYNLRNLDKIDETIEGLIFLGLVEFNETNFSYLSKNIKSISKYKKKKIRLTNEGIRVAKLIISDRNISFRLQKEERKNIFIACRFGNKEIDKLCEDVFFPICKNNGYKALRIDQSEPTLTITDEIIQSILDVEIIIADLTFARPSVYFEVGYAIGNGIDYLLTCRKDHLKKVNDELKVHFDLEQFKISFWTHKNNRFYWGKDMNPKIRIKNLLNNKKHIRKTKIEDFF